MMPLGADPPTRSPARVVAIGAAANVVCLLPVFLTGSMATFIEDDLSLGAATLGFAVALYRGAGAVTSPLLGRRVDRIGATKSARIATAGAALASLGIALTAHSTLVLVLWLMFAGCTIALSQPAANRLLASGVTSTGLGKAFGFKQSAPPVASTVAGLSVPLVAFTVGWRWAFVAAAILALLTTIAVRPVPRRTRVVAPPVTRGKADRATILVLAAAFGLGTSVSSSITTFFVVSAVEDGTGEVVAGTLLAVAGMLAVVTRIVAGVVSDRTPSDHLRGCAWLVSFGAIGVATLAVADTVPLQTVGVVVAIVGTWGFNGVFWFALIKAFPGSPGAITGSVAPGALLGSTIGPIVFGLLAEGAGYPTAYWVFTAVAAATAVGLVAGNSRLRELAPGSDPASVPR
jgi:MFS family permease